MEVQVREDSQRRSSIKRPWDEDTALAGKSNGWHGALLPPIDDVPYHRPQPPRRAEPPTPTLHNGYDRESTEHGPKRPRWNQNNLPGEAYALNGTSTHYSRPPAHPISSHSSSRQAPLGSPSLLHKQTWEAFDRQCGDPVRPLAAHETTDLCQRCRRMLNSPDTDSLGTCEDCHRNPGLIHLTKEAAAGLTQLVETLSSGIASDQRDAIRERLEKLEDGSAECPPLAQFGLNRTLHWILSRINHVNSLADKLLQHVPPGSLPKPQNNFLRNGDPRSESGPDTMKRRIDSEPDNGYRPRPDAPEPPSEDLRRRFVNREDLPSIRSQYDYHGVDGPSRRNIMNPPPAPAINRQLPSPPGRPLSSPTSINFPSPSAASYRSTSQPVNLPPPSSLHQSTLSGYLPQIGSGQSPESALQAHTAALQHEVSVQKIAFSSLQGEHDKLLAAYSRSQTRASALEKKHNVSDAEIINLTEDKLRLQGQVIELEREVEDLTRSRDQCRQSAVHEGAQYVEIVRRASQLEARTGEERKSWNTLKAEMEKKMEALNRSGSKEIVESSNHTPNFLMADVMDIPAALPEPPPGLKIEPMSEPSSSQIENQASNEVPPPLVSPNQESAEELSTEIRRLQRRCIEMEDALRTVREESHSMEGIVRALSRAGKTITDKANRALDIE
ncbi:hypothetical protein LSUB1_G006514 [Lachnellula subtilissima]|uniref:Uncharacterized protein n=1 Tax=Lachnellula subtilissima TaxID=602034 RepID=A0A8H8RHW0_9HELO|nr:hypothetical protein LSUB1_G006514 [Lachnellula subtilissima]